MGRRNRKMRHKFKKTTSEILRCGVHTKPVLEHESCDSFTPKKDSSGKKNCERCKHSI